MPDAKPSGHVPRRPDYPFTTDGCSGVFMRLVHLNWRLTGRCELSRKVTALCKTHDLAYHPGGTAIDRVVADAALMVGIAKLGHPVLARMMLIGVSIGGLPWWPLPWRWGYGYEWPRGYRHD